MSIKESKKTKKSEISEIDDTKSKKKKEKSEVNGESKKKNKSDDDISKKKKKARVSGINKEIPDEPINEVERLRKSQYVRDEKLRNLRAAYDHSEELYQEMFAENYDNKIDELEYEIKRLKMTLEKQKNTKGNDLHPVAQMQIESDWFIVQIREWTLKIDSLESKFDLLKRAHKNAVEALQQAHVHETNQIEMSEMRQLLAHKKNDLYEASQLISELQKVAFSMLPQKVAKHCEEIENTMTASRQKLDDINYQSYRMKMKEVSSQKEITALKTAIDGEHELEKILLKKTAQNNKIFNDLINKKDTLDYIITNGFQILETIGIGYYEALGKAEIAVSSLEVEKVHKVKKKKKASTGSESDLPNKRKNSLTVAVGEKINFLMEKSTEIDKEIIEVTKEKDKTLKDQQFKLVELKKLNEIEKNVEKLNKTKESLGVQLQQEVLLRKAYYNQIEDLKGKIRVNCRCRPISKTEIERGNVQCVIFPDKYTVAIHGLTKDGKPREFQFDRVFPPEMDQNEIFEDTSRLIQSAIDGFNVSIMAYGQTGSGKTYTLIGNVKNSPGIVPRTFIKLFEIMNEGKSKFITTVKCYMLELYNEKLLDLMMTNAEYSDKLEVKKNVNGMVIIPGAELIPATSAEELEELFLKGNSNRHIASTKMNSESSRSHLIISMMLESTQYSTGKIVRGKISIVDLAGSERIAKSGVKGVAATEATSINMSLSALGDVISALTTGQPFVPYRNNKLTLLMQDSLGGNSKTLMFVNISPVDYNASESCNSLVYAQRVKLIKNDAIKVADTEELPKLQIILEKLLSGENIDDLLTTS